MSAFQDIRAGFRKVTNTVIRKTDELAEEAAIAVKKKTVEAHLSEAYEKLGRISYQLLSKEGTSIRENEEFLAASCEVTRLRRELRNLDKSAKTDGEAATGGTSSNTSTESSETAE